MMDGPAFKAWRVNSGFAQATVAKRFDVSPGTVANWENGSARLPSRVIKDVQDSPNYTGTVLNAAALAVIRADPRRVGLGFDPDALGCTPLAINTRDFNVNPIPPGWQEIPICRVICHADIPNPVAWTAPIPLGGGEYAIMGRDGSVWRQTSGKRVRAILRERTFRGPRPGSLLKNDPLDLKGKL